MLFICIIVRAVRLCLSAPKAEILLLLLLLLLLLSPLQTPNCGPDGVPFTVLTG